MTSMSCFSSSRSRLSRSAIAFTRALACASRLASRSFSVPYFFSYAVIDHWLSLTVPRQKTENGSHVGWLPVHNVMHGKRQKARKKETDISHLEAFEFVRRV